jgi:hypothetical protein
MTRMDKNLKNTENEAQIIKKEDLDHHHSKGIYMRDDHCDWGSSGMSDLIEALNDSN